MPNLKNSEAFKVPELTDKERCAFRSFSECTATEQQQALVLSVIVHKICRTHDVAYIPDSFDQTAFFQGRAFVGKRIIKELKYNGDS